MTQSQRTSGPADRLWLHPSESLSAARPWPAAGAPVAPLAEDLIRFWLLQDLPPADLRTVTGACQARHYHSGAVIFREKDPSDGLYLIAAGTIYLFAMGQDEGDMLLASVSTGECFGEMGVVDGARRSATAVAKTPTDCYFLPLEAFRDLMERVPLVPLKLLALLSRRMRRTSRLLTDLSGALLPASPTERQHLSTYLR